MKKIILATLAMLLAVSTTVFSQSTFINEIDYLGNDQGAEIAGPVGQDLAGWSLVYYTVEGNIDKVIYLSGLIIPGQQNGFGSVWMEVSQSGPGGALALVNTAGNVIQFLSYGAYTSEIASGGAASGMSPDYAGAQLTPDNSLQLTGTGLTYLDFIWSLPLGQTPGQINTNQFFPGGLFAGYEEGLASLSEPRNLKITLFPNPAIDQVQISLPSAPTAGGFLRIFSLSGQLLRQLPWPAEMITHATDVRQLPAGQYIVQVTIGQNTMVQRFSKQ